MLSSNHKCSSKSRVGQFGIILVVSLSAAILFGAGTNVEAATNSSSCTLIWTAPGDDGVAGTASAYNLRYSVDSAQLVNSFDAADSALGIPSPSPAGSRDSFTVNNLLDGTTYYFAIKTIDDAGNVSPISNIAKVVALVLGVDDDDQELPQDFSLSQNYPNPFNPATTIEYSVATTSRVRLTVYNIRGQTITTLVDDIKGPGRHEQTWNGSNDRGSQVASGVYFYRLETDHYTDTKKMVLLK